MLILLYLFQGSRRHRMDKANGTLLIMDVKMGDAGTYACVANTTGHPLVTSSLAYLRVKSEYSQSPITKITMDKNKVKLELNQVNVTEQQKV